jgi:DNA-binding LacI/PurR family transcriptional regulator
VTYLIRLGHRRIGYLMGPEELAPNRERLHGYHAALVGAGLEASDLLIVRTTPEDRGGFRGAVELLARQPRPTALLACNDLAARGAIDAARQMGLDVPAQLSVVGFDDTEFAASLDPPLTTVRYPAREIAALALECLARISRERQSSQGTTAPESLTLPTQLVVRGTSAPPASDRSP